MFPSAWRNIRLLSASKSLNCPFLDNILQKTCNCKSFHCHFEMQIFFKSFLPVLQPKPVSLKDLGTISLKCNQGKKCSFLSVSQRGSETHFGRYLAPSYKTMSCQEDGRKFTFKGSI